LASISVSKYIGEFDNSGFPRAHQSLQTLDPLNLCLATVSRQKLLPATHHKPQSVHKSLALRNGLRRRRSNPFHSLARILRIPLVLNYQILYVFKIFEWRAFTATKWAALHTGASRADNPNVSTTEPEGYHVGSTAQRWECCCYNGTNTRR
jgi:hypothetical protein